MRVKNIVEARRLLNNLSSSLVRALIALVLYDISDSKKLAYYLDISRRNSRRIISILNRLKVIRTLSYGRKTLILSVDKYIENEILGGIQVLVPYIIDRLGIPITKLNDKYVLEVTRDLIKILGFDIISSKVLLLVKREFTRRDLSKRVLPDWLRRILKEKLEHGNGILTESAKRRHLSFNYTFYEGVGKTVTL